MNTDMPQDLKKWEVARKKGKTRFILLSGVLAWGVPMFVIMTFFVNRRPETTLSIGMLAGSALVWAISGACFGWAIWTLSERRYRSFLESRKDS